MRFLSLLLAGAIATAAPAESEAAPAIAITNVTLLDGRGGASQENMTVLIRGDRVEAVESEQTRLPKGTRRMDGSGRYLVPAFIDMHAHLLVPRCEPPEGQNSPFDRALSERMLSTLLDFGITTVRSPANPTAEGLKLRDDLNSTQLRGPRAFASAELINDGSLDERALRSYVREALEFRPDYFKVYARLSPDQVSTVVDEAHRHGIPVIGHLQRTSWTEGARLGVDHLTHAVDWSVKTLRAEHRDTYARAMKERGSMRARLDWLELLDLGSEEVATMLAEVARRGITVDPTLVAYDSKFSGTAGTRYRDNRFLALFPELKEDWLRCGDSTADWTAEDRLRWRRSLPKLQRLVKMMHESGVTLTTGSDLTNEWLVPGESLHQEFELLQEAGISPAEILRMTGENASRALRRADVGVVEPGRRADLVLLNSNPLISISNTRDIAWVMQGGVIVSAGPPTFQNEAQRERRRTP